MINRTLGNIFKGDKVIWMVFFFLCVVSVVEVYSASSELTYRSGNYLAPMLKHIGIFVVGVAAMVIMLNIPCKYFRVFTPLLLVISVLSLIAVYYIGESTNGASRYISLLGIKFQPSEIAKGTLVLATAQILSATQTENGADRHAFKYILLVCAVIVPLIMVENLSTAVLLCAVIFMMMVLGRVPAVQLGKLLGVVMAIIFFVFVMVMSIGHAPQTDAAPGKAVTAQVEQAEADEGVFDKVFHRFDTWKARIYSFFDDKDVPPSEVDLDKDGQVSHANIAIATSNLVGKGPGNSVERDFLSQAFSDFIYAIIIEEMGIIGAAFVAILYIILLFRTGKIAGRCANSFPALLAMGLALLLVTQALFNMCVAVGLVPVTGQPLPLVSKGGTSTIINCVYIGVILSISRSAKRRETPEPKPVESNLVTA